MPCRSFLALAALASLASASLAMASGARAQDDARASAAARALFQEGIACTDHADWDCAADRFGQAYRLRPSPVIGSNYAIALAHLERWVEAAEAFRAVQRDATASADLRADASRQIAAIEPHFGRVVVRLTGPRDGVTVTMDGHDDTSLLGVAAPSDPGEHRIEAHRDGQVVASATTSVAAGERVTVELVVPERPAEPEVEQPVVAPVAVVAEPEPLPPAALALDEEPPPHHEVYDEWWFWTIVGVGVAAGIGVGVGVAASQPTVVLPMGSLGTIDGRP